MTISNDLMESFEWKTEDWGENRSLILSKSKQDLSKIGILHNFANFIQRKDSQAETREQIVTDFWDPINPKKVPSVICATVLKKTGIFLWHFHVPWIFGTVFWHHIYNSWLFSFGNWNSRAFSIAIPHLISLIKWWWKVFQIFFWNSSARNPFSSNSFY